MVIRKEIDFNQPLTPEQVKMLDELDAKAVIPDDDCPELTPEQMTQFRRHQPISAHNDQERQDVTISLTQQTFEKASALGNDYKSVLSRIIESVFTDPNLVRKYL